MISLAEFVVADPPDAWRAAGFAVDESSRVTVGRVTLRCAGPEAGSGIVGWALRGAGEGEGEGDLDGLPTRWVAPPEPREGPEPEVSTPHPNGALLVDHVVVMTPDAIRTTAAFEACGLDLRRVREAEAGGQPVHQRFFRAGEVIVEVVEVGPAADAAGPARFWGLAFTVADLDATADLLGDALGAPHDAVQPGRRIATLRHRRVGIGQPVAFMSVTSAEPARSTTGTARVSGSRISGRWRKSAGSP